MVLVRSSQADVLNARSPCLLQGSLLLTVWEDDPLLCGAVFNTRC